jgi:hypothetical protein
MQLDSVSASAANAGPSLPESPGRNSRLDALAEAPENNMSGALSTPVPSCSALGTDDASNARAFPHGFFGTRMAT